MMPAKGKELRVHIDPLKHAWVGAVARAKRTSPARIIDDLIDAQLDLAPRVRDEIAAMQSAREMMECAQKDGDRIGELTRLLTDMQKQRDNAIARCMKLLEQVKANGNQQDSRRRK